MTCKKKISKVINGWGAPSNYISVLTNETKDSEHICTHLELSKTERNYVYFLGDYEFYRSEYRMKYLMDARLLNAPTSKA